VFTQELTMNPKSNAEWTRRSFFFLAGGAAAAFAARKAWPAPRPVPTGIQLYTVGADFQKDPAGTLKQLAEIGYKEVETAGFGKLSAAQLRDMLKDTGLRAPSAHLMFGMADTDKLLDDAKALGVEYVVSSVLLPHPPQASGGMQGFLKAINSMTADDFKQSAAKANEIAGKAKGTGLQYAYHNHNFEFRDLGGGETGYEILMRETDPSLVKFEADTGWMRVAGADPVAFLTQHPERFVMLHIKDFKNLTHPVTSLMAPDAPTPTELGRGDVDIKPIVAAGRKAGIRHMFVEQEPPFKEMTPMEAAAVDYRYLHGLLAT
jgi:sugar phosphate isomerase/epimerase